MSDSPDNKKKNDNESIKSDKSEKNLIKHKSIEKFPNQQKKIKKNSLESLETKKIKRNAFMRK